MASDLETVTFSDLKSDQSRNQFCILDVRNRDEVTASGQIPGTHCIPVTEIDAAVALSPSAFNTLYGFQKPDKDSAIVTHCMMGGRAAKGAYSLKEHGFKNVKCYSGSLKDWIANDGELIKPGKPYSSA